MAKVNFSCIKGTIVDNESVYEMDEFENALDEALQEIEIEDKQKEDEFQAYLDQLVSEYEEEKQRLGAEFDADLFKMLSDINFK